MKLKLCGIRRLEDIGYINEFPPDYIGFVFAESKRQVSVEQAATLAQSLHPGIQTVGVFVNAPLEHLLQTAERVRLDILQLHGDEDASYIHALRQRTKCPIWKAVRVTNAESIRRAEKLPAVLKQMAAKTGKKSVPWSRNFGRFSTDRGSIRKEGQHEQDRKIWRIWRSVCTRNGDECRP